MAGFLRPRQGALYKRNSRAKLAHFLEVYEEKRLIKCFEVDLCATERTRTGKLFILDIRERGLFSPRSGFGFGKYTCRLSARELRLTELMSFLPSLDLF